MVISPATPKPKVIVGIGNPGPEYQKTRHNFGFRTIDKMAEKIGIDKWTVAYEGLIAEAPNNVLLVKPLTYVNRSGNCVRAILQHYKLDTNSLLIVVDDVSLPLGTLRIRYKGSSGGHNGLESIITLLTTELFPRLRLGINNKGSEGLVSHVLSEFTREEERIVADVLENAALAAFTWINEGIQAAMNKHNRSQDSSLPQDSIFNH